MGKTVPPSASACPACIAAPSAERIAAAAAQRGAASVREGTIMLSLPTVHCAACISAVERRLMRHPGVRDARVNLSLKRVSVEAGAEVGPQDLIKALEGIGYEAHELDAEALAATAADRESRDLLMRLAVAGFAMMNVMLLSVAVWSGAADATRDLFHWISALITLPVIAFSAQPFFRNAWKALRVRRLNMDVPISLAIVLAAGLSLYETMQSGRHAYFDAALSLTFFLLAGRYLDFRTRAVARSAAQELSALEVHRATRIEEGEERSVSVGELRPGDLIVVRPGGRMPADGIVERGESELDRSLLTGETMPVFAGPGMAVSAGEINLTGPLTLRVTAAGEESSLNRLADLVAMAESAKNSYTSLADRAARAYAPGVHLLSALAFIGWYAMTADLRLALNIAVAVLIITCPCALGLAVPAVVTAASGRLFRRGMLIKSATALERLAEVDTVVFDKTGTLTQGAPEPLALDRHPRERLSLARALAEASSHPLARSLAGAIREMGIEAVEVNDLEEVPGHGVRGRWQGREIRLGRADWLGAQAGEGTATWLKVGDEAPAAFEFKDHLRKGAEEAVRALEAQGMEVILLSGDSETAVRRFAAMLGIGKYHAGVRPEEKAEIVIGLAADGRRVLMVGDGLNDTAALAAAHVSISPATALDAARVASDIVMMGADISPLGETVDTARRARARIRENFAISLLYNLIAVPIALAGYATPLAAALAMSASSITVSLNALRLRR